SLLENGDLGLAIATYEAHPRRPTDTRLCSAAGTTVPQYQMRKAYSTTPGEDPPRVAPRSSPPRKTKKRQVHQCDSHARPQCSFWPSGCSLRLRWSTPSARGCCGNVELRLQRRRLPQNRGRLRKLLKREPSARQRPKL